MDISKLVQAIGRHPKCVLRPPAGKPSVSDSRQIPQDLREFYERCGGAELFSDHEFGFTIVSPTELTPANPALLGSYYQAHKEQIDQDISAWWHLIARGTRPEEAIVIDLHPDRLGWCYEAWHQTYATPDSRVVAHSFTALIESLLRENGEGLFWEREDFEDLGFAYSE